MGGFVKVAGSKQRWQEQELMAPCRFLKCL